MAVEDVILNDSEPNLDAVRRWGYDKRLLLIEQDEDLVLGDIQYIPLLLELAADPLSPKGEHALLILWRYCKFLLEWRHRNLAAPIARIAEQATASPSANVREWAKWFQENVRPLLE
jgi:hypothetical protein